MKELTGISLFNGHSGAYIAARDANIKLKTFYASEVDKYANIAAKAINPNTIFLGDVRRVEVSELDHVPDILFGGSPCTDLSFAGTQSGLIHSDLESYLELRNEWLETGNEQLYFHNGKFQQSILFWEYIRILKDLQKINPQVYFFLENVRMSKQAELLISETLGLFPVAINSNRVSAQNRYRLYWTNIKTSVVDLFGKVQTDIPQPADRGILLKDILQPENEVAEKYYIKNPKAHIVPMAEKSHCIDANYFKSTTVENYLEKHRRQIVPVDIICMTPRRTDYGKQIRKQYESGNVTAQRKEIQQLEPRTDEKTNCLTTVQKDNLLSNGFQLRRLTPIECARLQTVPDADFWKMKNAGISDTQLYKMFGNGWTIEVIKHILSYINTPLS